MRKDRWKKAEIEEKLGIKRGRIQEWVNAGYITPREPATQGKTAYFDRENCYEIGLFVELLAAGTKRAGAAGEIIRGALNSRYLVNVVQIARPPLRDNERWMSADSLPQFVPGQFKSLYVIDVQAVMEEVDAKLD